MSSTIRYVLVKTDRVDPSRLVNSLTTQYVKGDQAGAISFLVSIYPDLSEGASAAILSGQYLSRDETEENLTFEVTYEQDERNPIRTDS